MTNDILKFQQECFKILMTFEKNYRVPEKFFSLTEIQFYQLPVKTKKNNVCCAFPSAGLKQKRLLILTANNLSPFGKEDI